MTNAAPEPVYVTSGIIRLTRPQLVGTMTGLLLTTLLAAIDQTIVATALPDGPVALGITLTDAATRRRTDVVLGR